MVFRQLFDYSSYTYTYLIADGGRATLIDPVLENIDQYLGLLKELDLTLDSTIETHVHADHVTAAGKLREATGCTVIQGVKSAARGMDRSVDDGDVIAVGAIDLKVLYTPGHTDDSYCFLMERGGQNYLFSGDTLFIRGTGRTDFQHGDSQAHYNSIFNKLLTLPEDTLVYPGHDYRGMTVSTIGEEKRFNPRLQVASAEDYAHIMDNLNLPNPKLIDIAVPANIELGLNS
ncbi:MAG: MBL fold metallo-hydrolase [Porticoccaceae bacterium]|nr:MBL fold metallo-hydrolase [Porticoccaceae bacterium]